MLKTSFKDCSISAYVITHATSGFGSNLPLKHAFYYFKEFLIMSGGNEHEFMLKLQT